MTEKPEFSPVCCGKEAKWVNPTINMAYFYCDKCKKEVVGGKSPAFTSVGSLMAKMEAAVAASLLNGTGKIGVSAVPLTATNTPPLGGYYPWSTGDAVTCSIGGRIVTGIIASIDWTTRIAQIKVDGTGTSSFTYDVGLGCLSPNHGVTSSPPSVGNQGASNSTIPHSGRYGGGTHPKVGDKVRSGVVTPQYGEVTHVYDNTRVNIKTQDGVHHYINDVSCLEIISRGP